VTLSARFGHTNLVARDWRRLANFYCDVFGCVPVPPERDLAGPWLDAATAVPGMRIQGVHLRLPGHGVSGPTLEIFSYAPLEASLTPAPNRPGFGHIAFQVPDVEAACAAIRQHGGGAVGSIAHTDIPGAGPITFAYMRDPEGNVIEVQRWGP
jgi:catechol 2,3-dioxygenase-like lactoylglutathione lyase family enzyme